MSMARSFLARWAIVCITLLVSVWLIACSQRNYDELISSGDAAQATYGINVATGSKSFGGDAMGENGNLRNIEPHNSLFSASTTTTSSSKLSAFQQEQQHEIYHDDTEQSSIDRPVTRTVVVAASWIDDTGWLSRLKEQDPSLRLKLYHVQDQSSPNRVPANKGHEAMVYLTYIIDALNATSETSNASNSSLSSVTTEESGLTDLQIFIHAHDSTWHNNNILNSSTHWMISRLNSAKVQREGFFNLRCHWDPGCDGHPLEPACCARGQKKADPSRVEECQLSYAWEIFFPNEPIPEVLSAPCCAQFAVSREQITRIPLERYVAMRDWLLETPLHDRITGRIFEYTWHYLFGLQYEVCPNTEWGCYCEAYGVCFDDGPQGYENWMNKTRQVEELKQKANDAWYVEAQRAHIEEMKAEYQHLRTNRPIKFPDLPPPVPQAEMDEWIEQVHHLEGELVKLQNQAIRNGDDAARRSSILRDNRGRGTIWRSTAKEKKAIDGQNEPQPDI